MTLKELCVDRADRVRVAFMKRSTESGDLFFSTTEVKLRCGVIATTAMPIRIRKPRTTQRHLTATNRAIHLGRRVLTFCEVNA